MASGKRIPPSLTKEPQGAYSLGVPGDNLNHSDGRQTLNPNAIFSGEDISGNYDTSIKDNNENNIVEEAAVGSREIPGFDKAPRKKSLAEKFECGEERKFPVSEEDTDSSCYLDTDSETEEHQMPYMSSYTTRKPNRSVDEKETIGRKKFNEHPGNHKHSDHLSNVNNDCRGSLCFSRNPSFLVNGFHHCPAVHQHLFIPSRPQTVVPAPYNQSNQESVRMSLHGPNLATGSREMFITNNVVNPYNFDIRFPIPSPPDVKHVTPFLSYNQMANSQHPMHVGYVSMPNSHLNCANFPRTSPQLPYVVCCHPIRSQSTSSTLQNQSAMKKNPEPSGGGNNVQQQQKFVSSFSGSLTSSQDCKASETINEESPCNSASETSKAENDSEDSCEIKIPKKNPSNVRPSIVEEVAQQTGRREPKEERSYREDIKRGIQTKSTQGSLSSHFATLNPFRENNRPLRLTVPLEKLEREENKPKTRNPNTFTRDMRTRNYGARYPTRCDSANHCSFVKHAEQEVEKGYRNVRERNGNLTKPKNFDFQPQSMQYTCSDYPSSPLRFPNHSSRSMLTINSVRPKEPSGYEFRYEVDNSRDFRNYNPSTNGNKMNRNYGNGPRRQEVYKDLTMPNGNMTACDPEVKSPATRPYQGFSAQGHSNHEKYSPFDHRSLIERDIARGRPINYRRDRNLQNQRRMNLSADQRNREAPLYQYINEMGYGQGRDRKRNSEFFAKDYLHPRYVWNSGFKKR